ncbi:MAG TPA: penicillin-binding protein 1B [Gammaproteobacteria bacterium]|nr:penicillin-binding protein 1B [Gammaproteobacteria bacterium]
MKIFKFIFFLVCLAFSLYLWHLNQQVTAKFEGVRWALPAHVYARPLSLYSGAPISQNAFETELQSLGYKKVSHAEMPGSYNRLGQDFSVVTRGFDFWDGSVPSRRLRLGFSRGHLTSIRDQSTAQPVELFRLEPQRIGGIYPKHNEDRELIQLSDVPPLLIQALLVTEDHQFYQHYGISIKAIARALVANIRAGATVQGGSTLTQQLVKNFYLSNERTLQRKVNEALMALLLDFHYNKDDILEAYLNEIYMGQQGSRAIHGFGLASWFYFGRPLAELDLAQLCTLVAIVKGPSYYNPRRHPERITQRRNLVLTKLYEQGWISESVLQQSLGSELTIVSALGPGSARYPAFVTLVRQQLSEDYSADVLQSKGLRIFTTLDPYVQFHAEQSLRTQLALLEKRVDVAPNELQGAIVVSSRHTGEVLALVGDRNPKANGFNRALHAQRPVGSLIKPFIFLTALSQPEQYQLSTLLDDAPLTLAMSRDQEWQPQNFDKEFHGMVPMHQALKHSYNVASVRLGLALGLDNVVADLHRVGLNQSIIPYPSLLLGAIDLSPLDVTQLYQTLGMGGFYTPLRGIKEVYDSYGEPLNRYPVSVAQVFDEEPVYLVNRVLQDTVRRGTGRLLYQTLDRDIQVAGKTGTTDDLKDSWFSGFTQDYVITVWLGRDDNQPTVFTGATGALRVWAELVERLQIRSLQLTEPQGIEYAWISNTTGWQVSSRCPGAEQLPIIKGSLPPRSRRCDQQSSLIGAKLPPEATDNPLERARNWLNKWF